MKKQLPELKARIRSNGLYKVIALLVSLVIWSTNLTGRKESVIDRDMRLEYITQPTLNIIGEVPKTIRIKVSGPRVSLKKFSQSSSVIPVNLIEYGEGTHDISLDKGRVELPQDLKVISSSPDKLRIRLKPILKKGS